MNDREVMQMALNALTEWDARGRLRVIEALRTALAQPEPEPVAWMHNFIDYVITKNRPTDITRNAGRWTPLYTAPPQREWAGLTEEEKKVICQEAANEDWTDLDVINATEAKLRDKNS